MKKIKILYWLLNSLKLWEISKNFLIKFETYFNKE